MVQESRVTRIGKTGIEKSAKEEKEKWRGVMRNEDERGEERSVEDRGGDERKIYIGGWKTKVQNRTVQKN